MRERINSENRNANVVKHTKKGTLFSGEVYAVKHTFGQVAENDSDDDDPTDPDYNAKYNNATPITRRKLKSEHDLEKAGKLGPVATFFTLIKGFVATGVLFLPKGWRNGGWFFSSSALVMSCIFSSICCLLLLEVRKKYKLSFSEIGEKAFGSIGKFSVDFFLAISQTLFVCAYITFICTTINTILEEQIGVGTVNKWILGACCFAVYVPLTLVRKIEKFAFCHIIADISIFIGVTTISVYAAIHLGEYGSNADDTQLINPETCLSFIGMIAYVFEGIGIIIPVMETTSRPDLYPYILVLMIVCLTIFYMFFGNFTYFVYGKTVLGQHPLITQILPNKDIPILIVNILWIVNLIFTYPLVLHPANIVIESYLYRGWPKSFKRQWMKNVTRTVLVAFTIVLSVSLMETLDKLESLNGAFACIPLAFLLPCLFHYKLAAETRRAKILDLIIAGFSILLQIVCTIVTFMYWND